MKKTIGFIGLGFMGHGMAKNLMEKGHPLLGIANTKRDAIEDLKTRGLSEAISVKSMVAESDITVLCLPNSDAIEAVLRGENGVFAGAKPGHLVIDTSTANPVSTLALAKEANARGIRFADGPLGRTPKEAWEGTLDSMIGATDADYEEVAAVASCYSGKVVRIGQVGAGHQMKLINNLLSMTYGALFAEALTLARKVGISPETFDSVIRGGRMDCGFYQTFMKYNLTGDPKAHQFAIRNGHKDLRYVAAMADSVGMVNPIGSAAKQVMSLALGSGHGDLMIPMLADIMAELNGIDLGHAPGKAPQKGG
jgi:3-hydroxyisobutyrate dehydrogenase-like beta-hydroxyacid dehydrogenase